MSKVPKMLSCSFRKDCQRVQMMLSHPFGEPAPCWTFPNISGRDGRTPRMMMIPANFRNASPTAIGRQAGSSSVRGEFSFRMSKSRDVVSAFRRSGFNLLFRMPSRVHTRHSKTSRISKRGKINSRVHPDGPGAAPRAMRETPSRTSSSFNLTSFVGRIAGSGIK